MLADGPRRPHDRIQPPVLELVQRRFVLQIRVGTHEEARIHPGIVHRDGMKDIVSLVRTRRPDLRLIGATVITALGSANHGTAEQDAKRRALNDFIRHSGLFDGIADFDSVTIDQAGGLNPEFIPDSTIGHAGDKLHPNRAGYLAMGMVIELDLFRPKQ